ncbi:uncharacterized protein [Periplaneta americana]|uniref:uncharacterized protein isoform X1 n=1 Tax=Periplaneta americana TaxID=6978 RepID=UPI0037E853E4
MAGKIMTEAATQTSCQNLYVELVLIVLTQASIQIMESSISEGGLGTTDKKLAASMGPIPAPSFEKEEENEEVSMFGLSVIKEEDKRRAKDGCCPCLKNVFQIQFMNYEAEKELRVEKEKKKETKAEEKNRKKKSQHRQHQAFFNSLCWRIRAKETIS